jgi:hypothetical protein
MTKALLIVTAIFEVATGLALIAWPSELLALVLGPSFVGSPAGARIAGGVLLALGVGCWLTRDDGEKPNGRRLITTMLAYNIAVALALAIAAIGFKLTGALLWPAVVAHAVLAAFCVTSLRRKTIS